MAQINLSTVSKKTALTNTDRIAVWPETVASSNDLQHTTLADVVTKVQTDIGSNYVTATSVDAKGDLFVATANNTVGILPVGTNGQVLTVDSTQTTGVRWTTPASTSAVYCTGAILPLSNLQNNLQASPSLSVFSQSGSFNAVGAELLVPTTGWYLVTADSSWAANSAGDREFYINFAGSSAVWALDRAASGGSIGSRVAAAAIGYLTASQAISFAVRQTSGGNLTLNQSSFQVMKVG